MILVHLSITGKPAILDPDAMIFAEESEVTKDGKPIAFTRVYLRQPLPGEGECSYIDVQESVETLLREIKGRRCK